MTYLDAIKAMQAIQGNENTEYRIRIVQVVERVNTKSEKDFNKKITRIWANKYNHGEIMPQYNGLYRLMDHDKKNTKDYEGFLVCKIIKEYKGSDMNTVLSAFTREWNIRYKNNTDDITWYIPKEDEPEFDPNYQ